MTRLAVRALALLAAFLAGFGAALVVLDHAFGGHGPAVTLRADHRRALDDDA